MGNLKLYLLSSGVQNFAPCLFKKMCGLAKSVSRARLCSMLNFGNPEMRKTRRFERCAKKAQVLLEMYTFCSRRSISCS